MKCLFCSVSSHGFLFPAVAVARTLADRGHETAFVTDCSLAPILAEQGLRRIPRGEKEGRSFELESWYYPLSIAIQVKHIEYALDLFEADVLIGQPLTIGPYIVSERRCKPLTVLGLASPLWPTDPELLNREPRTEAEKRRLSRHEEMLEIYNKARKLFRLPRKDTDFLRSPLLGDVYLAQSIPELWEARGALADRVHLVGSCLWESPGIDEELDQWLTEARFERRTVVYMEFGRNFKSVNPLQKVFTCLEDQCVRIAASVGRCDSELGEVPENFFVRDFMAQGKVLPHADLVISGGSSTVTLGALTHGLPALILHGGGEQTEMAELCESAGAAIALPVKEATPADVLEAMRHLVQKNKFLRCAQIVQKAFKRYDGPEMAATKIEELALGSSFLRASAN